MKSLLRWAFDPGAHGLFPSLGLLILRLVAGGLMVFAHGWGKLVGFSEKAEKFADPIGLGGTASLGLAVFAEVFCAIAIVVGFATRVASIPLITTMAVAAFVVHGNAPIKEGEMALIYGAAFALLLFTGAGSFSIDNLMRRKG